MIRDAFEILSWYLSPRRLPWFAIAEFALGIGAILGYQLTGNDGWLVTVALGFGAGTYFAAHFYADIERRPETKRERERLERQTADWFASLSERDKAKIRALGENMARLSRQSGISFKDAAASLRRFN